MISGTTVMGITMRYANSSVVFLNSLVQRYNLRQQPHQEWVDTRRLALAITR